jgi:hypothetical protein
MLSFSKPVALNVRECHLTFDATREDGDTACGFEALLAALARPTRVCPDDVGIS